MIKNQDSTPASSPREAGVKVVSRPVRVKEPPVRTTVTRPTKPAPSLADSRLAGQRATPSEPQPKVTDSRTARENPQPSKTGGLSLGKSYPKAVRKSPGPTGSQASVSNPAVATSPTPKLEKSPGLPGADWGLPREPKPTSGGEGGKASQVTRRARPTRQPEFNLSKRFPDLQSVSVKAEFKIAEDGTYEPTLLTSTGNPTADVVILGKLLEFKWLPALEKGVPVKDVRVIDITLEQ